MKSIHQISLLGALALLPLGLFAQGTPSAQQMIEQLQKPAPITAPGLVVPPAAAPAGAPRTRSLRNLTIESTSNAPAAAADAAMPGAAPVAAAPAPRPSLSLQIQFDFNSAKVRPESQQALANLAQALKSKELEASRFAIEGHTDAKGTLDYNQRLSQQRADAVRDYLASQGVAMLRLSSVGKGSSDPALPDTPLAPENRRVRIVNLD